MYYRSGGLILIVAPIVAILGLGRLLVAKRWKEFIAGVASVAIPVAAAWMIGAKSWNFDDADRRVAVGGIGLLAGYLFVLMGLFVLWGAPDRLLGPTRRKASLSSTQSFPQYSDDEVALLRKVRFQGLAYGLVGFVLTCLAWLFGDALYYSERGWLEVGLYWAGTALVLTGVYRGLMLGWLGLIRDTPDSWV